MELSPITNALIFSFFHRYSSCFCFSFDHCFFCTQMTQVSFSIASFIESLPEGDRPRDIQGRLTQKKLWIGNGNGIAFFTMCRIPSAITCPIELDVLCPREGFVHTLMFG